MEEKYKNYDKFLTEYFGSIEKSMKDWEGRILVINYDEKRVEDVFLVTVLNRVLTIAGYDYKVELANNNIFNFLKMRKKIGKDILTRNAFQKYYGFYYFTIGYREAIKMMEKGYNYTEIRKIMEGILKDYYGVEGSFNAH